MEKVIIFGMGDISQIAYLYLSENKTMRLLHLRVDKEYIKGYIFRFASCLAYEKFGREKFSPK